VAIAICAALVLQSVASGEEPTMRLRIAWGEGQPRQWQARISLSKGEFCRPALLGLEPDEPGSLTFTEGELVIRQRSQRSYDGVEVGVIAPLDAKLAIELTPLNESGASQKDDVELKELISGFHSMPLDEAGSRLLVRRAPGDVLRVQFDRPTLVFDPGESFVFEVAPQLLDLDPGTPLQLRIQLVESITGRVVWSEEEELRVQDDGSAGPSQPPALTLPTTEGVYDLVVSATKWRLRAPFVQAKPTYQRKVQLVVADPRPRRHQPLPPPAPELSVEIDPTSSKWWERFMRLPQLAVIPGWSRRALGNEKTAPHDHESVPLMRMDVGGWQAYPLPISAPGQPHILEIEYPGDVPQTLGISIVEPDMAGQVGPFGVDSGIDVTTVPDASDRQMQVHRLPFWPRTKAPLVLLANQSETSPAMYGKIRVYQGLGQPVPPPDLAGLPRRLAAAYFDKPFFTDNFSATKAMDPWTRRPLDDWVTFYQAGQRLLTYLRYSGRNAAVVSTVCEGGGLYPSELLQPTPRFDTGTFFGQGQDPVRKDVVEMLLRMFDREQLSLIPAIRFDAPLPELERQLEEGDASIGIEWVGGDGRTWLKTFGARRGVAPYYNPLDERVQDAMVKVVREVVQRYGHHPSFHGVALTLDPAGYGQLPGSAWGFDDRTIARFWREMDTPVPGVGESRFADRRDFLLGEGKMQWLDWRARRLAHLYQRMSDEVRQANANARLYLVGAGLLESPAVQMAMRPALPRRYKLADALLEMGLDPARYAENENILLLRPHRLAPRDSLVEQGVNSELEMAPAVDRLFEALPAGSVFYHSPKELRLASFDAVSPFGEENTRTHLFSHLVPTGPQRRKRLIHSLATFDSQVAFDGGWFLPMGQEDALREVLDTYQRLPAVPFETVGIEVAGTTHEMQPVTIRTFSTAAATYVYLVNDSPWPVTLDLALAVAAHCDVKPLSTLRPIPPLEIRGGRAAWSLKLRPYDLVGAVLSVPQVTFQDAQVAVDDEVKEELRSAIRDLEARAHSLDNPQPTQVLSNPDFEKETDAEGIPGWRAADLTDAEVSVSKGEGRGGGNALRIKSAGPVIWVRSEPIEVPDTGRLHVAVWLRSTGPANQSAFRLALDGQHLGRSYYRYATVGVGDAQLGGDWAPYVFQLNDLPVKGWQRLEIGFDLMGPGEVLVDEVRVYDKRFNPNEQRELSGAWVALAEYYLREGKLGDCQRVLESYWPQFLFTHVPPSQPRVARGIQTPSVEESPTAAEGEEETTPTMMDRMRRFGGRVKFW
jgi:hypothetical protein